MKLLPLAIAAASAATLTGAPLPRPVYVLLVSTIEDHLNTELSEERIERTLPIVERYRREHPALAVSCLMEFTGAVADSLAERPSSGLAGRLRALAGAHVIEIGYTGDEEPTPLARPRPNLRGASTPEARWLARLEAADWFLHERKHPLSGEPDPARVGGLARVRDVFGSLASASGTSIDVGADPEIVHLLDRDRLPLLLPGFTDAATFPARLLNGYRGGSQTATRVLSPAPDTAPEVFWQDHTLRYSEYVGPSPRVAALAVEGPDALRALMAHLDRSRVHVVRVRLGSPSIYTKVPFGKRNYATPLEYAYDNPKDYRLPADAVLPREAIEANYAKEQAALRWLVEEFLPANPGSRFVSAAGLAALADEETDGRPTAAAVLEATRRLVDSWPGAQPPAFVESGGRYFSLADMFALLTATLADRASHGRSTEPRAIPLFGPLAMPESDSPVGRTVSITAIERAATSLAAQFDDASWARVPHRLIPGRVEVDGTHVNAAQFLRAMADALLAPDRAGSVTIGTRAMYSLVGEGFPRSRARDDMGPTWTLKPARLRTAAAPSTGSGR